MTAPLVRRSPVHGGRVVATAQLTPRMRRVTVQADSMIDVPIRPAQDVELHLVDATGRRVKRRYTIRAARPDVGELDLDVFLHGDGPGAQWGMSAVPGDAISFQGPRGKLEVRRAPHHLLVGDESALPAIGAVSAALPTAETATAVIEVQDGAEEQELAASVMWVHRGSAESGTPERLLPAVTTALDRLPAADARAYLMGETRTVVALRALLEERGVPHDAIFVKGYWNPRKRR